MTKIKHKRQLLVVIGAVIFIAALAAGWYFITGMQAGEEQKEVSQAVPVEVMQVQNRSVKTFIELTGRLQPGDRIDIFSEVTGIMEATGKPFKAGVSYRKGELLLRINDDEARQNIISQRAGFISLLANTVADIKIDFPEIFDDWADYLASVQPDQRLPELPEVQNRRQKLFLTGRNVYGQFHAIRQMEERLSKYNIYAPYLGTLTEVKVDRGTLVMQGQPLGEFVRSGIYELKASVGIQERPLINPGDTVNMRLVKTDKTYIGTIDRINEKVNPQMQTIDVYVKVAGEDLTPGMYLSGQVVSGEFPEALRIPRNILIGENRVFTVEDSVARLLEVEVLHVTADDAVVRGLKNGSTLIVEKHNAAFEGSEVAPVKQEDR